MPDGVVISAAVEGIVDEAVARMMIAHVGATVGDVYGKQGKSYLRQKVAGYNNAARRSSWLILVDLDRSHGCAPTLLSEWLPEPAPHLCFRVVVRAIEAWLMADGERLAAFLRAPRKTVPEKPEELVDPKITMVNLARVSRSGAVREDMVPWTGGGRSVGPAYASKLIEFASSSWRLDVAAAASDSLRRAVACLRQLAHRRSGEPMICATNRGGRRRSALVARQSYASHRSATAGSTREARSAGR